MKDANQVIGSVVPIVVHDPVLDTLVYTSDSMSNFIHKVRSHIKSIAKSKSTVETKQLTISAFLDLLYMNHFNLNEFNFGNKLNIAGHYMTFHPSGYEETDTPQLTPDAMQEVLYALEPTLSVYTLISEMVALEYDQDFISEFADLLEINSYLLDTPTDPQPTLGQAFYIYDLQ